MKPLQLSNKHLLVQLASCSSNPFVRPSDLCSLLSNAAWGALAVLLLICTGAGVLYVMVLHPAVWALAWTNGFYVPFVDAEVIQVATALWLSIAVLASICFISYKWSTRSRRETALGTIIRSITNRFCVPVEITRAD
jgi:hypothetical protein